MIPNSSPPCITVDGCSTQSFSKAFFRLLQWPIKAFIICKAFKDCNTLLNFTSNLMCLWRLWPNLILLWSWNGRETLLALYNDTLKVSAPGEPWQQSVTQTCTAVTEIRPIFMNCQALKLVIGECIIPQQPVFVVREFEKKILSRMGFVVWIPWPTTKWTNPCPLLWTPD